MGNPWWLRDSIALTSDSEDVLEGGTWVFHHLYALFMSDGFCDLMVWKFIFSILYWQLLYNIMLILLVKVSAENIYRNISRDIWVGSWVGGWRCWANNCCPSFWPSRRSPICSSSCTFGLSAAAPPLPRHASGSWAESRFSCPPHRTPPNIAGSRFQSNSLSWTARHSSELSSRTRLSKQLWRLACDSVEAFPRPLPEANPRLRWRHARDRLRGNFQGLTWHHPLSLISLIIWLFLWKFGILFSITLSSFRPPPRNGRTDFLIPSLAIPGWQRGRSSNRIPLNFPALAFFQARSWRNCLLAFWTPVNKILPPSSSRADSKIWRNYDPWCACRFCRCFWCWGKADFHYREWTKWLQLRTCPPTIHCTCLLPSRVICSRWCPAGRSGNLFSFWWLVRNLKFWGWSAYRTRYFRVWCPCGRHPGIRGIRWS